MDDKDIVVKLSLLINFRNLLNITASRGAFKADEFKIIGTFYDQINELIKPHLPQPAEPETSLDPVPESKEDNAKAKTI